MISPREFNSSLPTHDTVRYFTRGTGEEWNCVDEFKYNKLKLLDLVKENLELGLKVELYSLVKKDWELVVQGSPGNQIEILEYLQSETVQGCLIGSLGIKNDAVNLVFTDAQGEKEFIVSEFIDNDLYTDLEARLVSAGVKELLISKGIRDFGKIKALLEKLQVAITIVQESYFDVKSLDQDLKLLLNDQNSINYSEYEPVFHLIGCLIKYLGLMNSACNFGKYTLKTFSVDSYMKLDGSVIKALNLVPTVQDGALKNRSLYGVLNYCQTGQGSRLLSQWLRQPLLDLKEISIFITLNLEKRQDIVETMVMDSLFRQDIQVSGFNIILGSFEKIS